MGRSWWTLVVIALAGCGHGQSTSAVSGATTTTVTGTVENDAAPRSDALNTTTADRGCDTASPASSVSSDYQTVHTIAPGVDSISYSVSVTPTKVCAGDDVRVTVYMRNNGKTAVTARPQLILNGVFPHPILSDLGPHPLEPGQDGVVEQTVKMPVIPAGTYDLEVYGYFEGVEITVVAT